MIGGRGLAAPAPTAPLSRVWAASRRLRERARAQRPDPAWFFAPALIGYPLAALLGILAGADGHRVSWAYRLLVACLAAQAWVAGRGAAVKPAWPILAFLAFEGVRLAIDGANAFQNARAASGYFIAFVIVPVAGITAWRPDGTTPGPPG